MDVAALLLDLYGRVPPVVEHAVTGLDPDRLRWRPAPGANPIGWLVWHLARVQDHHVSELLAVDQLWAGGAWASSFELEPDPSNTGYGHTADDVATVRPRSAQALLEYFGAAHERTIAFVGGVGAPQLDEIVDRRWDPPVSLGVRLVSVADDCLEHAGQAAYVRGLLDS